MNTTFTLSLLAFLLIIQPANGRPKPKANAAADAVAVAAKNVISELGSIFKVGPGMRVFNTGPSNNEDDDEIICAERSIGKSYCTEIQNYAEATQLDKIDAEQFELFKSYFQDDIIIKPQNVASRMQVEAENPSCNSKSRIIYPKGALSKEAKWLLVVQHEQHKQGVLVEECENVVDSCSNDQNLPLSISAKCIQRFAFRKVVVLVNGVMKEQMVKLPNFCECILCSDVAT
ncbi:PREDICTED: protein spaetzle-like [Rhagoletis zephyria]|uniref:protein spaetzle-like n=1 Tax=Rhagoletis zephyria TaxID=28612 RepID=UPI000811A5E3|nr:PREDICTED: protein spaetzle-like [Rhagoletis zephyria]